MGRYAGAGEFDGGPGMIAQWKIDNGELSPQDEVWSIYATDIDSSAEPDPRRVALPASYASRGAVQG